MSTRIWFMSDLHCAHDAYAFVKSMVQPPNVDVLIIAGDLCESKRGVIKALQIIAKRVTVPILYTSGNHEYFDGKLDEDFVRAYAPPGVTVAQNFKPISVASTPAVFRGGTLWYNGQIAARNPGWAELAFNRSLREQVGKFHAAEQHMLKEYLGKGDIVFSHMLPSYEVVTQRWRDSFNNELFVGAELAPLIRERKPALWLFGHTHDSTAGLLGETLFCSNPRGYGTMRVNREFDPSLVITI